MPRVVALASLLVGCRAILGIEEGFLETTNVTEDGGGDVVTPSDAGDGGGADAVTDGGPGCLEVLYSAEAIADTFIADDDAGSYGGQSTLLVGQLDGSVGLVTFALTSDAGELEGGIARLESDPSLSTQLELRRTNFNFAKTGTLRVHVLRPDWTEGIGTTDGARWTLRTPADAWQLPGASAPQERSTAAVGSVPVDVDSGGDAAALTIRVPLTGLAPALGAAPIFTAGDRVGLALVPGDALFIELHSRESGDPDRSPRIVIRGPCRGDR